MPRLTAAPGHRGAGPAARTPARRRAAGRPRPPGRSGQRHGEHRRPARAPAAGTARPTAHASAPGRGWRHGTRCHVRPGRQPAAWLHRAPHRASVLADHASSSSLLVLTSTPLTLGTSPPAGARRRGGVWTTRHHSGSGLWDDGAMEHAVSLATLTPPIALGPLDGRYRTVVAPLVDHLSEAALNRARLHVEVEWLIHLTTQRVLPGAPELSEQETSYLRQVVATF